MKNPSSDWTPEERLAVAFAIGQKLVSSGLQEHPQLSAEEIRGLGTRLMLLKSESSGYLDAIRKRILEGIE